MREPSATRSRYEPEPAPDEETMTRVIYLDCNATTPLDPAVVDAMQPYLREHFGNPSSRREQGCRLRGAGEIHAGRRPRRHQYHRAPRDGGTVCLPRAPRLPHHARTG